MLDQFRRIDSAIIVVLIIDLIFSCLSNLLKSMELIVFPARIPGPDLLCGKIMTNYSCSYHAAVSRRGRVANLLRTINLMRRVTDLPRGAALK